MVTLKDPVQSMDYHHPPRQIPHQILLLDPQRYCRLSCLVCVFVTEHITQGIDLERHLHNQG